MASKGQVLLIASGDLRLSANQNCWAAQHEMEQRLQSAVAAAGHDLVRAHPYKPDERHGFIASQREGIEVFKAIDPAAPLIVAEAVWQYSHHVLAGLTTHRGPILTVANWSGQWPGLVGMLNLNGSLTKADVDYSTLWSEDFTDDYFTGKLREWLATGQCSHDLSHVTPLASSSVDPAAEELGRQLAQQLVREKAIMGVFDEGCMGMFNAIVPDHLLHRTGVFKERLSQSALYHETMQVSDDEAAGVRRWMEAARHAVSYRAEARNRSHRQANPVAVQDVCRGAADCRRLRLRLNRHSVSARVEGSAAGKRPGRRDA